MSQSDASKHWPNTCKGQRLANHKQLSSNSFLRRAKQQTKGQQSKPSDAEQTCSEESSGQSSPVTNDCEPVDAVPAAKTPLTVQLSGWLLKKHAKEKSLSKQWGKRFFWVDDYRGTLSYAKGENKKANVILPLLDISQASLAH